MQNINNLNIHKTITPLYNLSRNFCLWPYRYDKNYKIVPLSRLNKLLTVILNLTVMAYFCWSIYGRIRYVYNKQITVTTVTDIAFGIPLFLLTFISFGLLNSKEHRRLATSFHEQLDLIDKQDLHLTSSIYSSLRKQFTIEILAFYMINITAQIIDFSFLLTMVGITEAVYYIGNYIIHNLMIVVLFQIKFKANILQQYFEIINQTLLNFTDLNKNSESDNSIKNEIYYNRKTVYVKTLCLTHGKLCDLIETTSTIHGVQILLLICCIITMILNALFYSLITGLGEKYSGYRRGDEIFISCNQIFVAFMHFVLIIMFARQCSSTTKEARKTGSIANELLLEVSMENKSGFMSLYRRQLKILLLQAHYRNSTFSAAGFFAVDYSMVLTLMGAVGSYFIILLQFKSPNDKVSDSNSAFKQTE